MKYGARNQFVGEMIGGPYTSRQAAYDLKKLPGKRLVRRIRRTGRYKATPSGLPTLTALIVLREKVIRPVLAGAGPPKPGHPAKSRTAIDQHYLCLPVQLRKLLEALRMAA